MIPPNVHAAKYVGENNSIFCAGALLFDFDDMLGRVWYEQEEEGRLVWRRNQGLQLPRTSYG